MIAESTNLATSKAAPMRNIIGASIQIQIAIAKETIAAHIDKATKPDITQGVVTPAGIEIGTAITTAMGATEATEMAEATADTEMQ